MYKHALMSVLTDPLHGNKKRKLQIRILKSPYQALDYSGKKNIDWDKRISTKYFQNHILNMIYIEKSLNIKA